MESIRIIIRMYMSVDVHYIYGDDEIDFGSTLMLLNINTYGVLIFIW